MINNINKDYIEGKSRYYFYEQVFIDSLNKIQFETFDNEFEDLCSDGVYSINGNEYSVREVYIVKCEDGSVHLIKAGENNLDVLTNNIFSSNKIIKLQFTDSRIFYDMYIDGLFKEKKLYLTSEIFNRYIIKWNGEKHLQTKEQIAEVESHEKYQEKYG